MEYYATIKKNEDALSIHMARAPRQWAGVRGVNNY